ncbi:Bicarbonate transport ATP-binding protein CmpD [bioreactor metagenome]|uniref:Bicarbonate transport ATP-binding protein CmpD n=1 Tax=bioreactor metagenome TaxID=1076179 RepID=A0A645DM84_9ZZZZ|nr:ATP-binding cassette domain-containing protein [Christensenella sp.]
MADAIIINNITKCFDRHAVLLNFSAEISLNGVTAIRGASGAGKTTLFRLLLGLETPDCGTMAGMERRKTAVVFQEDRLLPWATALENVSLVSDERRAKDALSKLGLSDSLNLLPRELSGGMKRRVAIARALAYQGDILFLDEPFTGLDEENKRVASEALLETKSPIIVITHDEAEAMLFGTHQTLLVD